jgi:hypothetical protein
VADSVQVLPTPVQVEVVREVRSKKVPGVSVRQSLFSESITEG